jgi:hypothetical protein
LPILLHKGHCDAHSSSSAQPSHAGLGFFARFPGFDLRIACERVKFIT